VDKVKINHVRGNCSGIRFAPNGPAQLHVSDSLITNNGSAGVAAGITVQPASGAQAKVTIEHSWINNNFFGIVADATNDPIRGVVPDSVVSASNNNGLTAVGSAVLSVENTNVSHNNYGLVAGGGSGMLVNGSRIVLNNTGLFPVGGGALLSYKNNSVNGNTTT